MKCVLLLIQLICLSLAVAQITFTREWVAGKRGSPALHASPQDQCASLWPAIEILMETDKFRQDHCGNGHFRPKLIAKLLQQQESAAAGMKGQQQAPDDDSSLTFEEEMKSP